MFSRFLAPTRRLFLKKRPGDDPYNAFEWVPSILKNAPEEDGEPVTVESLPKNMMFNVAVDGRTFLKDQKILEVEFMAHDGRMGLMPGTVADIYKVVPGVLDVKYSNERTEKYYTTGGYMFQTSHGPCLFNSHECIKLEDLDHALVKQELNTARNNFKSRDEKTKMEAFLYLEILEQLEPVLDALENE